MAKKKKNKKVEPPTNVVLTEYENLIKQVLHQDDLFWKKSQFFLLVQSAFLAGSLQTLKDILVGPQRMQITLFALFVTVIAFNIYICFVWLATSRRTREYIDLRISRLKNIETESHLKGILKTFEENQTLLPTCHRSSRWEIHLSSGFIIIWLVLYAFICIKAMVAG